MAVLLNTIENKEAREVCRGFEDRPDELLEILHRVQKQQGFLSDTALRTIAHALNISRAEIQGVVSFYHDYKREQGAAVTVKICRAEACQAVDVNKLIADAEIAYDTQLDTDSKSVKLESTYCLGNCALGPAIMIDERLYGRVDLTTLKTLVTKAQETPS